MENLTFDDQIKVKLLIDNIIRLYLFYGIYLHNG